MPKDPVSSTALKQHIKPTNEAPQARSEGNVAIAANAQPVKVTEWTDAEKQAALEQHGNWSKIFRALDAEGKTKGEISKLTGKRYQHVRNVLITPIGKQAGNSNAA
jgi:hypothetical protein